MGNVTLSKDNIAQDLDQKDILSVIPEEVLVHILSYLPGKHLIHVCRVVCKLWKAIIDSASLWIRKCEREGVVIPPTAHSLQLDFRVLYLKNPYGRNLLRNWNAEEEFAGWTIEEGGDGFAIEDCMDCPGSEPLDPTVSGTRKCWSTSYSKSRKRQCLDLLKEGCCEAVLDQLQPPIETSVWTAARRDCGSVFVIHVRLQSASKEVLDEWREKRVVEQWQGGSWVQLKHTFKDYPQGVRYITYADGGMDLLFWAGHYGPKMAAPSLRFQLSNTHT
ncbi:hypothetical protein NP493_1200g00006 [Ridgeia piscesae]|uniref:Uncharacterized protein n=1 Tax=Ridgeia piscesae TaxID=27915 RepID=A0AAD9KDL9_RIDPI|nr:hypothetical protein NP493_1200g00006 [Ridgeia piscesae]